MRSGSRVGAWNGFRRRLALSLTLPMGLPIMLAGCGGGTPPAAMFKPPNYSYLTPLRLNVGQIQIQDNVPPAQDPTDLASQSPVPPDQALKQMAQDRLVAAGNSGAAVFTIDQAAITGQPGGALDGTLAVHLDIVSNSGGHAGYAEAHVSRQFVPGSGTSNDGLKSELYDLTTQMMQDMNVEFEFQLRRTLGDWMLDASGAPVSTAVQQQSLDAPDAQAAPPASSPPAPGLATGQAPALVPASVGAPMQLAPPAASVPPDATPMDTSPAPTQAAPAPAYATPPDGSASPTDAQESAPVALSPPPGVLQAPPGAVPVPAPAPSAAGPLQLAPAPNQAQATTPAPAPAAVSPGAPAYHGVYPTPPGYHPAVSAPDSTATPSGS